jgi:protocatechuate 3,4-dioxygenase alpha subunit
MAARRNIKESASQTAGPYVHIGLVPNWLGISAYGGADLGEVMVQAGAKGERIRINGLIRDGAGDVVRDALVEIWQADADGRYPDDGDSDPQFMHWGRAACDLTDGSFRFETIKPGRVADAQGRLQAPHILVWIVARGIMTGLVTRVYFGEEAEANKEDPLLKQLGKRAETLIASRKDADGVAAYEFNIRLQGDGETVFLDI